jgi:hypothetical protein
LHCLSPVLQPRLAKQGHHYNKPTDSLVRKILARDYYDAVMKKFALLTSLRGKTDGPGGTADNCPPVYWRDAGVQETLSAISQSRQGRLKIARRFSAGLRGFKLNQSR